MFAGGAAGPMMRRFLSSLELLEELRERLVGVGGVGSGSSRLRLDKR